MITIDEKRHQRFNKIFEYHDLLPLPFRFWGVVDKDNTPVHNCYMAHRNAIMKAKELDWPFVCIFEDDAYPCNNVRNDLEDILKKIPATCLVFHLGWTTYKVGRCDTFNDDFITKFVSWGTGSYVVLREAYDRYIKIMDEYKEADGVFFSEVEHDILKKNTFFAPRKRFFLQFNGKEGSMHLPNAGYYLGKPGVGWYSEEEIFNMGFPKFQDLNIEED